MEFEPVAWFKIIRVHKNELKFSLDEGSQSYDTR